MSRPVPGGGCGDSCWFPTLLQPHKCIILWFWGSEVQCGLTVLESRCGQDWLLLEAPGENQSLVFSSFSRPPDSLPRIPLLASKPAINLRFCCYTTPACLPFFLPSFFPSLSLSLFLWPGPRPADIPGARDGPQATAVTRAAAVTTPDT